MTTSPFLGLLRHEWIQLPTEFSVPLIRKSVVFLDLPLDSPHYRLIAAVLRERMEKLKAKQADYGQEVKVAHRGHVVGYSGCLHPFQYGFESGSCAS